jgi:hypothetical protein
MQVLENKKRHLVTAITKCLQHHDLIDHIANILYHGEFKKQILNEEFDKKNEKKEGFTMKNNMVSYPRMRFRYGNN